MTRSSLFACAVLLTAAAAAPVAAAPAAAPAAAAPAAATPGPAASTTPERPALQAARDAVVVYHLAPAAGEAIDIRVIYRAAPPMLRFDLPDTTYILVTPQEKRATMVVPLEATTADLPWAAGPQVLFLLDEKARYTRRAETAIAGQKCTQWDVQLEQDRKSVCVTADGLVLRVLSQDPQGRRNLIEALSVAYQTLPPLAFMVPQGYEAVLPSAGPSR